MTHTSLRTTLTRLAAGLGTAPLLLGLLLSAGVAQAQTMGASAPATRVQIKMDRDEFIRSHRYDIATDTWTLLPGYEAPVGVKSREQVKAERDTFLRTHRFDEATGDWVAVGTAPRDLNAMTRAQVRAETLQFARTHSWDAANEAWVANPRKR